MSTLTTTTSSFADVFTGAGFDGSRWRPAPVVEDRAAWAHLDPATVARLVESAQRWSERAAAARPGLLPWVHYGTTGERTPWEREQNALLAALTNCTFALAATGEESWWDAVGDLVWRLCEMTSWCLPSHYALPEDGSRPLLPPPGRHVLDLAAGYTGGLLAAVDRIAGDGLEERFPGLRARMRFELRVRVLDPWHAAEWFWFGVGGHPNNWAPWIVSNVLACAAVAEDDLADTVARAVEILDRFRTGYGPDGSCDEGATYFWWAAATMVEALDVLEALTGSPAGFAVEPVAAMARFPMLMQFGPDSQVDFGDAGAIVPDNASWHLLARYGARVGDDEVVAHARWMGRAHPLRFETQHAATFLRTLAELRDPRWAEGPARPGVPRSWYGESTETVVAHERAGDTSGFALAVKGGHNDVSHNHDDVGGVIVSLDTAPVLIDVGVGTYRRETFVPETRYGIWTMRSSYHSVPFPDGVEQSPGSGFRAVGTRFEDAPGRTTLFADLAPAYPLEAGLERCLRATTLHRGPQAHVTIEDEWTFDRPRTMTLVLMTRDRPDVGTGFLDVGSARISYDAGRFAVEVEPIEVEDPKLDRAWGPRVHRVLLVEREPARGGRHVVGITRR